MDNWNCFAWWKDSCPWKASDGQWECLETDRFLSVEKRRNFVTGLESLSRFIRIGAPISGSIPWIIIKLFAGTRFLRWTCFLLFQDSDACFMYANSDAEADLMLSNGNSCVIAWWRASLLGYTGCVMISKGWREAFCWPYTPGSTTIDGAFLLYTNQNGPGFWMTNSPFSSWLP